MSTFGEIIEPGSRVAWEDWDDIDNQEQLSSELKWHMESKIPEIIETLFILEGKYLSDCVNLEAINLQLINTIPEVKLSIFKVDISKNYVCLIKDYNLVISSEIVELLREYLKVSQDVIAIQTKPFSEYQTMTPPINDCIIRAVSTSDALSYKVGFPKLEQPNIISGISAGVVSLREHLGSSGTAVVCYIEQLENVNGVHQLLKKFNIFKDVKTKPISVLSSNLYM